jgi:hypothetical protein
MLLARPELFISLLPTLPAPDPPLLFPPLRRASARARGVGGSDRTAFTATLC